MSIVKWGVLGVASIATTLVIPAIQRSRNGRVVAIGSRSANRAAEAAGRFGIARAYGSYEAVLEDPEVQAIYIPLPNSLHHEWTFRCADAGKHILCEKPLSVSVESCQEMVAACKQRGVLVME